MSRWNLTQAHGNRTHTLVVLVHTTALQPKSQLPRVLSHFIPSAGPTAMERAQTTGSFDHIYYWTIMLEQISALIESHHEVPDAPLDMSSPRHALLEGRIEIRDQIHVLLEAPARIEEHALFC